MSCGRPYDTRLVRRMVAEQARSERQRAMWVAAVTGAVNGAMYGARGVPPDGHVRIGDAEREQAIGALGEHFAAGRLSKDEFDERGSAAWAAKTSADLAPLFSDLPALAPPASMRSRRPAQRQAWRVGFGLWWVFVLLMVLGPGLLGGFTTVSAWAGETATLVHDDRAALAGAYVVATLAAGLVAAALGRRWSHQPEPEDALT